MSLLIITVEVFAGANIAKACAELQALADRLSVIAIAEMNGVQCMAIPGGDALTLAQRQQVSQASKDKLKMVNSRPGVRHGN